METLTAWKSAIRSYDHHRRCSQSYWYGCGVCVQLVFELSYCYLAAAAVRMNDFGFWVSHFIRVWHYSFGYDTIHSGMTLFIRVWHYSFGYVTIVGVFHYLFGYVTNYSGMSLIIRVSLISACSIRVTTISEKWKISDKARHSIGFVK